MRAVLPAFACVAVLIALLFARPHATSGPPMRDFEAYYAAGSVWDSGGDAYSQTIWRAEQSLAGVDARRYQALPFVGPPALLPAFGALARLPGAPATLVWRFFLIACMAALALVTLRLARLRLSLHTFVAIAIAALGFGPLTSALALGQIALPAFLFATLALLWPPAALLAWMQPNVGLTLVQPRRAVLFLVSGVLFAALCVAAIGTRGLGRYLAVLHAHATAEQFSVIQITPGSIAYGLGIPAHASTIIGITVTIAALCSWLLLMRRVQAAVERFCATCALLPLAMPFFHEHDLIVVFVPAVLYAVRCDQNVWPLAALGALLAATDWLGLAQRPDGTLQTLLLAGSFGVALIALRERIDPRMLAIPAFALILIGSAAAVAHAHPAPVWPDAMGALPRNVASMDMASAWNAQQHATGLLKPDAVWASLRMLSLLGCALTAIAIALSSRSPAHSKNPSPAPA